MATSDGPISISTITLTVIDLDSMIHFYQSTVGLNEISNDGKICTLGQGDTPLLHLREDRNAQGSALLTDKG